MFSSPQNQSRWNKRFSGVQCFTVDDGNGYMQGFILGKKFRAHRVAWALHYGEWPDNDIDHINGNKSDNRIANLREASRAQNMWNTGGRLGSSQYCGVSWSKVRQKWIAQINIQGSIRKNLGGFSEEIEAARTYDAAAIKYHGRFAKTNFDKDTINNDRQYMEPIRLRRGQVV